MAPPSCRVLALVALGLHASVLGGAQAAQGEPKRHPGAGMANVTFAQQLQRAIGSLGGPLAQRAHGARPGQAIAKDVAAATGLVAAKVTKEAVKVVGPIAIGVLQKQKHIRGAWCGFHNAEAALYLSRAGIQMALAVKSCIPKGGIDAISMREPADIIKLMMTPCLASIEGVVSSLLWTATYLSAVASECAQTANIDALCAGLITALLAAFTEIAQLGEVLRGTCAVPPASPLEDAVWGHRRLGGDAPAERARAPEAAGGSLNPAFAPELAEEDAKSGLTPGEADLEMSLCVVDAAQVAASLGTFSLAFDQMTLACTLKTLAAGMPRSATVSHEYCIVEVSYVLYSMFSAASFLGATLSHCSKAIGIRRSFECAAAAERIAAAAAGLPLAAAGLDLTCPGTNGNLKKHLGPLAVPAVTFSALGRRLDGEQRQDGALAQGLRAMGFNVTVPGFAAASVPAAAAAAAAAAAGGGAGAQVLV